MGIEFLAKELKKRNNEKRIGIVIGKIVEVIENVIEEENELKKTEYVKISILNGAIQKDKFYSLIKKFSKEDIGKEVIVSITEDNQEMIVLGYFKQFKGGV